MVCPAAVFFWEERSKLLLMIAFFFYRFFFCDLTKGIDACHFSPFLRLALNLLAIEEGAQRVSNTRERNGCL